MNFEVTFAGLSAGAVAIDNTRFLHHGIYFLGGERQLYLPRASLWAAVLLILPLILPEVWEVFVEILIKFKGNLHVIHTHTYLCVGGHITEWFMYT